MKKFSLFFLLLIMMLFWASPVRAGLGVSPSAWIEKNGLVGQQMEKTFILSRSNPDQDLYLTSQISGDIISWITINNGHNFVMAKGVQELPITITVTIPADTEHKQYTGEIRLQSARNEAQGTVEAPIDVLLSALITIDLTVSDQKFLQYDVLQITISDQEAGKPLEARLKIWNQGNVEAKPTMVTMDIFDSLNQTKLDANILKNFSTIPSIKPFSEGEITVRIPVHLEPERYWARVAVYQYDRVLKSDQVTFEITPELFISKVIRTIRWLTLVTGGVIALGFSGWFIATKVQI